MKQTRWGDRLFVMCNTVFLIALSLTCLLPFITLFAKSVSANEFVVSGQVHFFPKGFSLEAYRLLMEFRAFKTSFINSVFITVVGTLIHVFFTAIVSYVASKPDIPGRKLINALYIFTMLFSGGLIPTFLVVKETGLMNNLFVLVIPSLVSAFNMIIMRNYFEQLPYSLEESARIEGAGNLRVLFQVILPISLPSLATISIFYAVGTWNNYFGPLIYLNREEVSVLPLFLQRIISATGSVNVDNFELMQNVASESFRASAIFISAIPIIIIYPFLQKYFIKGMTMGAVK